MEKENLELAKEHIELAQGLVLKEAQDGNEEEQEELKKVEFALEKAGAKIKSTEE